MIKEGDGFMLSTGRHFSVSEGGLSPADGHELSYGYDDWVHQSANDLKHPFFTPEERREIAEYMIAKWQAWAA